MDGRVSYLHMTFKATNAATGSQNIFFAELAEGGQKEKWYVKYGSTTDGYDEHSCYVCAEKIKHPIGKSYKGGHWITDYWVNDSSIERIAALNCFSKLGKRKDPFRASVSIEVDVRAYCFCWASTQSSK
ncbi:hypothetical protein BAE44_0006774 [Dichanthelium oligosanthes]|uniref:DUF3615 domain-containing protein n=1 Tax=Dichanthelium oligosanthes TaxID=888268 RepID=A0A1E5W4N8_9POAL|nr:hypothetical protein BAE44_0006774 [Dichanthelium oligosanthes]